MEDTLKYNIINGIPISELAAKFVESLPGECCNPIPGGGYGIDPAYVSVVAEGLHAVIASVVAMLIDAGSERDAVMENDELAVTLEKELRGWEFPITHKE